ncbi:hypothetical protein FH972_009090 [Carpinus fangiana]|uniref:DIRP domain-containing protein n=1 Tax=Carpinus fangiana TaxID=176857 RepID=A0A5N6R3V6_9ROSI|nr:hypothetical protein FH972_009090 [Carpinus fangiana]
MAQSFPFPRQWKSARSSESFLDSGHRRAETDLAVSTAQFLLQVKLVYQLNEEADEKLSCCISSPMVRRWRTFEWIYSAIDYPWFSKRVFVEYLNHVGLGHIPRLTRVEWGVIRREKLKQDRDSVRRHYFELRAGIREGLLTDLARPLSVGNRVIALHPKSRELHDGSVLTVDQDKCRVQFDRPELGVEFFMRKEIEIKRVEAAAENTSEWLGCPATVIAWLAPAVVGRNVLWSPAVVGRRRAWVSNCGGSATWLYKSGLFRTAVLWVSSSSVQRINGNAGLGLNLWQW